jgi:hypothetical protein
MLVYIEVASAMNSLASGTLFRFWSSLNKSCYILYIKESNGGVLSF